MRSGHWRKQASGFKELFLGSVPIFTPNEHKVCVSLFLCFLFTIYKLMFNFCVYLFPPLFKSRYLFSVFFLLYLPVFKVFKLFCCCDGWIENTPNTSACIYPPKLNTFSWYSFPKQLWEEDLKFYDALWCGKFAS